MNRVEMYGRTPQKYAVGEFLYAPYMSHAGTKGMKWGVRRWQNPDGTLTAAGREHYGYGTARKKSSVGEFKKKVAKKFQAVKAKHNERRVEKKLMKGTNLSGSNEKKAKRRLSSLSDDELKKLTTRLKAENALLSEIATKEQNITNARNAKMNRQTFFSKYGKDLLMKVIDKKFDERKQERQIEGEVRKVVEQTKQQGRNAMALTEQRDKLGINNTGEFRTGKKQEDSKSKADRKDEKATSGDSQVYNVPEQPKSDKKEKQAKTPKPFSFKDDDLGRYSNNANSLGDVKPAKGSASERQKMTVGQTSRTGRMTIPKLLKDTPSSYSSISNSDINSGAVHFITGSYGAFPIFDLTNDKFKP